MELKDELMNNPAIDWRAWHDRALEGLEIRTKLLAKVREQGREQNADWILLEDGAIRDPIFALLAASGDGSSGNLVSYTMLKSSHIAEDLLQATVHTNSQGVIVFPGLGYAAGFQPNTVYEIILRSQGGSHLLPWIDQKPVAIEKFGRVQPGILLVVQLHPSLEKYCTKQFGKTFRPSCPEEAIINLDAALAKIQAIFPDLHDLLGSCIREVVAFQDQTLNSFAIEIVPGTIFSSLPRKPTVPFFIEDIMHQGGHAILDAALFPIQDDLSFERQTLISSYNANPSDERTVYTLLHAIFTELLISEALLRSIEFDYLNAEDQLEAKGRVVFALHKCCIDYQNLSLIGQLGATSTLLKAEYESRLVHALDRAKKRISGVSLEGQRYNFDLDVFCEANCRN